LCTVEVGVVLATSFENICSYIELMNMRTANFRQCLDLVWKSKVLLQIKMRY